MFCEPHYPTVARERRRRPLSQLYTCLPETESFFYGRTHRPHHRSSLGIAGGRDWGYPACLWVSGKLWLQRCSLWTVYSIRYKPRAKGVIYLNIANYNNLSFAFSRYHFNVHHFLWMKETMFSSLTKLSRSGGDWLVVSWYKRVLDSIPNCKAFINYCVNKPKNSKSG